MSACEAPGATSIRVALNLPFAADDAAQYLLSPEALAYWVGQDCELSGLQGSTVWLPTWTFSDSGSAHFGALRKGSVAESNWLKAGGASPPEGRGFELVVLLDDVPPPPRSPPSDLATTMSAVPDPDTAPAPSQRVALRLSVRSRSTSRLRIQHSGLVLPQERRASVKLWQGALRRLGRLMVQCQRSFRRDRQAVILVHGIGEQRPGQMLREFVSNIFDVKGDERYYVKPDLVSSLFEMRMASVPRVDEKRPTTDVYELYWAHLIRDTTLAQVYAWMLRLILSRDSKIPETLFRVVWLTRMLLVVAIGVFAWVATQDVSGWLKGLAGGALVALPGLLSIGLKASSTSQATQHAIWSRGPKTSPDDRRSAKPVPS